MRNAYEIFIIWLFILAHNGKKASSQQKVTVDQFKLFRGGGEQYKVEKIERNEELEYPGHDENLLEKLRQKWKDYYKCLERRVNETNKPELRRLIEGQNTVLKCDICARPFQNYKELEWQYKPLSSNTNISESEILDLTPEMELLPNRTLKIFNVVRDFEGLYVCYHGRDPISAIVLEISSNDTIERVPSAYEPLNKNVLTWEGLEYQIQYRWDEWSECSSCGTVGRKFRYATCFVSPKNEEGKEAFTWGPEIIAKFSSGVPCASPYLPKAVKELITNYKPAKAVVKFCEEPCGETEIFEVEDRFGEVIEIANNSAGIYSMYQKLPQLPPEIERVSITGELGKDIVIQCPGTSLANIPVTWAVEKKIIFPEVVANQSSGRFEIDLVNRISLKKLRLKDSHIYSCWQKGKLVGTVHLEVEKKLRVGFNHHITLLGIAAIIGTFLFVGAKVLTRKLNSKRK